MTCNDMNTIPPALIRPGRVDLKLHMGYIDNYQAELIFWRFFCMEEKETVLEDIPKQNYPTLAKTVNELIQRIRDTAHRVSKQQKIELEISPAELISYLLFHALKYKLSKQPQHLDSCCQSILDHIPDFIESVATDRKQAIEHAKKKASLQQMQQSAVNAESHSNADNATTTTTTTITKETKIIPTPPTSPAAEKKTASDIVDVEAIEQVNNEREDTEN